MYDLLFYVGIFYESIILIIMKKKSEFSLKKRERYTCVLHMKIE